MSISFDTFVKKNSLSCSQKQRKANKKTGTRKNRKRLSSLIVSAVNLVLLIPCKAILTQTYEQGEQRLAVKGDQRVKIGVSPVDRAVGGEQCKNANNTRKKTVEIK